MFGGEGQDSQIGWKTEEERNSNIKKRTKKNKKKGYKSSSKRKMTGERKVVQYCLRK